MPPSMARIAFFGTPEFALPTLRCLHAHHEVVLVVCTPDAPAGRGLQLAPCAVKTEATRLGLPITPSKLVTETDLVELARTLTDLRLDACVMVAFGPQIPERILEIPTRGFVMAHASLLPRWRGAAPIERALEEGDDETGVSLVRMTADRYAGDLYAVERAAILPSDNAVTLTDKLAGIAASLLVRHLDEIVAGRYSVTSQDTEGITDARRIETTEHALSWSWSARQIVNKARALAARGPLKITLNRAGLDERRAKIALGPQWKHEPIDVFDPRALELDHDVLPGTLLPFTDELVFATERGAAVAFARFQRSDRKPLPAALLLQELGLAGGTDSELRRRSRLVSAALRHVHVAEHLVANGPHRSLDEAFHVAGFGPECVQAACLGEEWFGKAVGHGFDVAQSENLRLLMSLDPRARRYLPADWGAQHPVLRSWTVQSRYQPTGTFDLAQATAMTQGARALVDRVVASLWADGLLDRGALR